MHLFTEKERERRIHAIFWAYLVLINSPLPTMLPGLLQTPMSLISPPPQARNQPQLGTPYGLDSQNHLHLHDQDTGLSSHPDREHLEGRSCLIHLSIPRTWKYLKIKTCQVKGFCTISRFPRGGVWILKCWQLLFMKTIGPCV